MDKGGSLTNTRRHGRELALKALFQVDVGKHPVSEVVDGVLDQVRAPIDMAVNQAVKNAQSSVRAALAEMLGQADGDHTERQLKLAARAIAANLGVFGERTGEITRRVVAEAPAYNGEGAQAALHAAAEETMAAIVRVAARPSSQPRLLEEVANAAVGELAVIEAAFGKHLTAAVHTGDFVTSLVHGALEHSDAIDCRLSRLAAHWSLARQAAVDRNILRLGAYELLFEPEIPTGATINEAVELAKKYSTEESGRFVNGVLGALAGNTQGQTESAA